MRASASAPRRPRSFGTELCACCLYATIAVCHLPFAPTCMVRHRASTARIVRIEPSSDPSSPAFDIEKFLFDAEQQLAERVVHIDVGHMDDSPRAALLEKRASALVDVAPRKLAVARKVFIDSSESSAPTKGQGLGKGKGIGKKRKKDAAIRRVASSVAPNAHVVSSSQAGGTSRTAQRHEGWRQAGNPHAAGYSVRLADADESIAVSKHATLANGKPSILRCIWRGLLRVKGREGACVAGGLLAGSLRRVLYRYSQQGRRSIHMLVNRSLKSTKGRDLARGSLTRAWVVELVSAVRLLWSPAAALEKVYRGVPRAVRCMQSIPPYTARRCGGDTLGRLDCMRGWLSPRSHARMLAVTRLAEPRRVQACASVGCARQVGRFCQLQSLAQGRPCLRTRARRRCSRR